MTQQNPVGTIRVIVVDDDAIVRETLSSILDSEPDIDVIATADNGAEAVALVHERTVDVALMDIQMPVLDGVEATSRIRKTSERTRVLLLTTFDEDTFLDGGIAAGASGFLLKTTHSSEIAGVILSLIHI